MQFEDSNECQRAFDLLLRRMEAMQAKGIAFERITYDAHHTKDYITKRIQLFPSWIKDSWYDFILYFFVILFGWLFW